MCLPARITLRRATFDDASRIAALQARSLRGMSANDNAGEINALIDDTDLLDTTALANGTYMLAEFSGCILAVAGWTPGATDHDAMLLGVFVDVGFSSAGLGGRLLRALEAEIAAAGLTTVRATTTYSGLPFFQKSGYRPSKLVSDRLPSGVEIHGVELSKDLPRHQQAAAA
jgi:N-acetylglutamate synthase-like GNAT family acetyltransferase